MKDQDKEPGISVGQIFLEEASFSHRADHLALPSTTQPDVGDVEVSLQSGMRSDGKGGLLRIRVATREETNSTYRFSVTVLGLFEEQAGHENMPVRDFVQGPAIALLFPFVREAVANLTGRGRFGSVWLNPINAAVVSKAMQAQDGVENHPGQPERTEGEPGT